MGIFDSVGSFLTNPEVEMLLPTVLGAAGGALSSPVMAGRRGAIGAGLQGASAGLTQGIRLAQQQPYQAAALNEMQQRTKLIEMQTEHLAATTANDKAWGALSDKYAAQLPEADRDQFLMLAKGADPAQRLEAVKYFKSIQALPQSKQVLSQMTGKPATFFDGLPPDEVHALTLKIMETAADGRKPQLLDTTTGLYMASVDPDNPSKTKIEPITSGGKQLVGREKGAMMMPIVDASGNVLAFNKRSGTVAETGATGVPKGATTDAGAMSALHNEYDKRQAANNAVKKANATATAGLDPETAATLEQPLPYPDLPETFDTYATSPEGKKFIDAYKGRAPAETPKETPKPKEGATPEGALAKVPDKAKDEKGEPLKDGVTYKNKDGTVFHIKDGYAFPGPAPR